MNKLRSPIDAHETFVWVRYLQELTSQASMSLSLGPLGSTEPRSLEAVHYLSDELKRAGTFFGVDEPVARWLLSLRELLDSHVLTAAAIEVCDLDETVATAMMQRGLDAVAAGLAGVPAGTASAG